MPTPRTRRKRSALTTPTAVGLLVALTGSPVIAVVSDRIVDRSSPIGIALLFQLSLWGLLACVLAVVVFAERQTLSSIGLRRPRWSTPVLGLAVAAVFVFAVSPLMVWIVNALGLAGFESGLGVVFAFPAWYRLLASVTNGVVTETLYRGYAIERLAALTGSLWAGALVAVLLDGLAHLPLWGPGPALVALGGAALQALVYLWRRDLLVNVIAHVAINSVGLVFLPPAPPGT